VNGLLGEVKVAEEAVTKERKRHTAENEVALCRISDLQV
jgi:hypothetical protein